MKKLTIAAIVALVLLPTAAHAGNYPGDNTPIGHPYSLNHYLWYGPTLTQTWVNVTNWNRTNNVDPTIFNSYWQAGHDGSDVAIGAAAYPEVCPDAAACTSCATWSSSDANMCLHYHIAYNSALPLTYDFQRETGCDELTHSMGLGHRAQYESTCKRPALGLVPEMYIDPHDKWEINNHTSPGWLNGQHVW